jgi:hypothetical protein
MGQTDRVLKEITPHTILDWLMIGSLYNLSPHVGGTLISVGLRAIFHLLLL